MTVLAHVQNGEVTGVYDVLPESWNNISNLSALDLNQDADFLSSLGWKIIQRSAIPSYNEFTQRLTEPTYLYDPSTDTVYENISVVNIENNLTIAANVVSQPPVDITVRQSMDHDTAMQMLRAKRDSLLYTTDHTQLADVIAINGADLTAAYVIYRQELRDLPAAYENVTTFIDANTVVYPTNPGAI